MSPVVTGGLVGAAVGSGLLLIVLGAPWRRRPALDDRVLPYLAELRSAADSVPAGAVPVAPTTVSALLGPWLRRLATAWGRLVGGGADARRRLARAGSQLDVDELRVEQVTWGLVAAAATAGLGLVASLRGALAPVPLVIGIAAAFVVGVLARDWRLSRQVAAREEAVLAELPAVVELLALSVAAGEGPVAALERVTSTARGAFPSDLRELLGHVSTGTPVAAALDRLAATTGVTAVTRFASTLAVAVDRGTPLVDVLHAQAADVREAGRRSLLETGAQKEVLMMVPVVFFVLPVTVVFAFFPGVVGLQLTTP
jgi:tight adherence protein C